MKRFLSFLSFVIVLFSAGLVWADDMNQAVSQISRQASEYSVANGGSQLPVLNDPGAAYNCYIHGLYSGSNGQTCRQESIGNGQYTCVCDGYRTNLTLLYNNDDNFEDNLVFQQPDSKGSKRGWKENLNAQDKTALVTQAVQSCGQLESGYTTTVGSYRVSCPRFITDHRDRGSDSYVSSGSCWGSGMDELRDLDKDDLVAIAEREYGVGVGCFGKAGAAHRACGSVFGGKGSGFSNQALMALLQMGAGVASQFKNPDSVAVLVNHKKACSF